MSKWRPNSSGSCLYVIPDIHGMINQLNLILSRILPLRKSGGKDDRIVFLGDYIDRGIDSHLVLDRLISLKKEYGDKIIFLKGNHEDMFLNLFKKPKDIDNYLMWMNNGGNWTLTGYFNRIGEDLDNPFLINRHRIINYIPSEHINFLNSLKLYHETDDYIFVHGGCDPSIPLHMQDEHVLLWDRSVFRYSMGLKNVGREPSWNKILITGHNSQLNGDIFINSKFIMLDGSLAKKLYILELNSMEGFYASRGNSRLVKSII